MEPFDFDEIFGDFDSELKKRMRELSEVEKAMKSGKLKGEWDVRQIDEPGIRGYVIRGHFWSDQPLDPLDPFELLNPWNRRPVPQRPPRVLGDASAETREPLTDVFEEEKAVKVYVELPGEEKDDIQLNVTEGKVEVKARNFYKMIDLPTRDIDVEKASSKYNNGVLNVTIPKSGKSPGDEKRKIRIE